jgi:hypothetical protein
MRRFGFTIPRYLWLVILGALVCSHTAAQDLPVTQVWLLKVDSALPAEPVPISSNERYNNQPMFSPDGLNIFFTAEQEGGQTDIARYEISTGQLSMVNSSPESEFSPTPIPGRDAVSVIRVEPPEQLQRLWSISLSGAAAELLMPNVEPVGYHTWISAYSVAVFILGDSSTLQMAHIGDHPSELLADNIGRTLRKHPESGKILFVDKNTAPWSIATISPDGGDQSFVMSLFPGVEDFEIDSKGRYWMGSGSKLYRGNEAENHWELAAELSTHGIDNITRLASSPDGLFLAIVAGR